MANRVILGAFDGTYVLRVSRPGFNVLSTGLPNESLVFDSRWVESSNIFMQGAVSPVNPPPWNIDIPFGTTFALPPVILYAVTDDGGGTYNVYENVGTHVRINGATNGAGPITSFRIGFDVAQYNQIVHYYVLRNFHG
ncbi:hypothetical protein [Aquamicrobium sp. LC103]|uniref:hypothetical protein n=1 Tax=Aquamicrobium sp. LC103 TaxID=1120658 RepID=UPI00063ECE1E|nr:hypothetical protein [Aquamicrobium sp. LC103]TKT78434.1 hypothetical protein XW59_012525 [Aquamicrobium sp. LC103]